MLNNFLNNGSIPLIRRQALEAVGEFDPACKGSEDRDFYLRLALNWPFVLVPKPQILYRQTATSMSSNVEAMEVGSRITIEKAFQTAPPHLQYLKN